MANNLEHKWFLPYSIFVKKFLSNTLYLKSLPSDKNVSVYYGTPSRAFAKYIVPVLNGSNLNPTVTFHLTSPRPATNQTPGGWYTKTQKSATIENAWEEIRHPIPYELGYRVTIWTTRQADSDILAYQAMTAAPNNRRFAGKVDGQWAELEVRNFVNETNLEPGEVQDVTTRISFDIFIPRAYLPLGYEEYVGTILDTDISALINEESV